MCLIWLCVLTLVPLSITANDEVKAANQSFVSGNFYCFKRESTYSVYLAIDQKGLEFDTIATIDSNGNASSSCNKWKFEGNKKGGVLRLGVFINRITGKVYPEGCDGTRVGNDSTYQWTFRVQRYSDVVSVNDSVIQVSCNFSDADSLYQEDNPKIQKKDSADQTLLIAAPSRVSAEIYLASPKLKRIPVEDIYPGLDLVLVVAPPKGDGSIVSLNPRSCRAQSPDGKLVKELTNTRGCSVSDIGFGSFRVNSTEEGLSYVSGTFKAFAFRGYDSLHFTCNFKPCFSINDYDCRVPGCS